MPHTHTRRLRGGITPLEFGWQVEQGNHITKIDTLTSRPQIYLWINRDEINNGVILAKARIQKVALKTYYVYILASRRNGTLYIGVTNDLARRIYEHKNDFVKGFTERYGVHTLVHYEQCKSIESAIQREKQLKFWHRKWKIRLIEEINPEWKDLYDEVV